MLMKEIKYDSIRKIYCAYGLKEFRYLNVPTIQSSLRVNPYQNSRGIFHRARTNNPENLYGPIKDSQSSLVREEPSSNHHAPWFLTILQSCSNQNSMLLAQK